MRTSGADGPPQASVLDRMRREDVVYLDAVPQTTFEGDLAGDDTDLFVQTAGDTLFHYDLSLPAPVPQKISEDVAAFVWTRDRRAVVSGSGTGD